MCGIIGYKGKKNAARIALEGLKSLEYRGYDSWGISAIKDKKLFLAKETGKIGRVSAEALEMPDSGIAIGHTRWATHGAVTEANAHPHLSNDENIAVVHNGIIENFFELRGFLKENGFRFSSETDTEVIPNLIEHFVKQGNSMKEAFRKALLKLEGNYAIVALHKDSENIFFGRNGSPLVLGIGDGEFFIASDIPAFLEHTNRIVYLQENEFGCLNSSFEVFDMEGSRKNKEINRISWTVEQAQKGNFPHFMLKEIIEQKETIRKSIQQDGAKISKIADLINKAFGTFFVACGTASYATRVGGYLFSSIAQKHINVVCGSEFPNYRHFLKDKSLMVVVSQSGETADTIEAIKAAKEKGVKVVSIVNVMGSTIMRMSDYSILTNAGPEIGVASTKATTAQIALLTMLAYACDSRLEQGKKLLNTAAEKSQYMFEKDYILNIENIAERIKSWNDMYVIGRSTNFPVALEAAHKIKEVSYIHAEGMAGGELKHGTIALIENGTPVIALVSDDECKKDILNNAAEIKSRGGFIIGISPENSELFDCWIKVPAAGEASPMMHLVPAQLLAYFLAVKRGCDPDKPRNLAKSVTVK